MNGNYLLTGIKLLLAVAFVSAGLAKIAGVEMMVATFDAVGIGQWFRYLTGAIEVGAAILLWVPGKQFVGAGLLLATMVGATFAHIFILGTDTMVPATALGALSAIIAYGNRNQIATLTQ